MVGRNAKSGSSKTSPPSAKTADVVQDDLSDQIYDVEAILKYRLRDSTPEYLIRWLGYPESANSWEPAENVNCPKLVAQYHASNPRPPKVSSTSSQSPLDASLRKLSTKPKNKSKKKSGSPGPKKAKSSGGVKKAKSGK